MLTVTPKQREKSRRDFLGSNTPILITNFALLAEVVDMSRRWNTVIVDEAHLGGLLNRRTKTFGLMQRLQSNNMFLLTGTPVRKDPSDVWGMLHLLDRKKFSSYWAFVGRYCHTIDNGFGKEILGRPKDAKVFNRMLYTHMVRNLKKNVLKDLPEKQRIPLIVELTTKQKRAYKEIWNDMMLLLEEDVLLTPNRMTQDLRL